METADVASRLYLAADVTVSDEGLIRRGAPPIDADPMVVAALTAGVPWADLADSRASTNLDALHRRRLLEWRVPGLAVARPMVAGIPLPTLEPTAGTDLSRFALIRRDESRLDRDYPWLLESGRSRWAIHLTERGLAALADLGNTDAATLRGLLALAGMLDTDDDTAAARAWEPHDRYFASRSRRDLADPDEPRPGAPQPGVRTDLPDGPRVSLLVPEGPTPNEPTLWSATESRRTPRNFHDVPLPLAALGALLWRTLRIQQLTHGEPGNPLSYDVILRPVPSGGALHASDLWLLVANVEDLDAGVWRYDALTHELVHVATDERTASMVRRLVSATHPAAAAVGVLTVRHARTSAKYRHWAYALELKDIGVLLHAVQLTAPALGLGVIPWGSGLTEPVAHLLRVDPEVDSPIGEFVLGVIRDG